METENQELKVQKSETENINKEETENQELKQVDTDGNVMENHEEKVVDKAIAKEKKMHLQDHAPKLSDPESLSAVTSKNTPADLQLDKVDHTDKLAVEGVHQPANSPLQSDTMKDQLQQPLVHDTLVKDDDTSPHPVKDHPRTEDSVENHVEKIKDIPNLVLDKEITKTNADRALDKKQAQPDLTLSKEEGKTHVARSLHREMVHEDGHDSEKVPVLVDHDIESHKDDANLPKTNDDSLENLIDQKIEQKLLKLKAAEDVGVRSRDLLHSEKLDENDLKLDSKDVDNNDKIISSKSDDSKMHIDELGGAPTLIVVNKTVVGETTSSIKRSMLSLKQNDRNETYSLNNGG